MIKVITRHVWSKYVEEVEENRYTDRWKKIYPKRKESIERVFGDCKEKHNLRFTRLRGLQKNSHQAVLIFACHNLVKMARWLWNDRTLSVEKYDIDKKMIPKKQKMIIKTFQLVFISPFVNKLRFLLYVRT